MFRKATKDDCKPVYQLICEMEHKELPYERFYHIFLSQIENENYYCLICEKDDEVIGELNLRFEEQLHHTERIAEIMEFSINANYQSQGIGKEMLREAMTIAKNQGCIQIEVACNQLRTDTHRFYLREGMNNYHFKFSKALDGRDSSSNLIGM